MKKISIFVLSILLINLFSIRIFAEDNTKISYSVPAKVTYVDGTRKKEVEAYLDNKLSMPNVHVPDGKVFAGFYYYVNQTEKKWNYDNDVLTYDLLTNGISFELTAKYVDQPEEEIIIDEETKTNIIVITKDYINYLDAELDLPYGAITISEDEKGKDIKIYLVVNEHNESNSNEKQELDKLCQELKQKVLTYFDITIEKVVDNNKTTISELNKKAKITITVPDDIFNSSYEYMVYRSHTNNDGDVIIDNVYIGKANEDHKITFESDLFSVYALTINEDAFVEKKDKVIISEEEIVKKINTNFVPLLALGTLCALFIVVILVIKHIKGKYAK